MSEDPEAPTPCPPPESGADCGYAMCGDTRCGHCFPDKSLSPLMRGAPSSEPIRRIEGQPMTLDHDGRRYVCIDPDEWARVSGAARSWSRLVECLANGNARMDCNHDSTALVELVNAARCLYPSASVNHLRAAVRAAQREAEAAE